ncbi:bZIP transcription factor 53-like [Pistacia vera]|uniref:bZIP transcription factor 53-like n=1 Tax=Pistacia vera TaxID=55513 RepID=UPI001263286F|nr:bZIP transcription factor 53-like [Pistacia vera]
MSSLQRTSLQIDVEARYAMMDEKKRKRMQSNRESAKRSRLKREKRLKDLVTEIAVLKQQIVENNKVYNDLTQRTQSLLSETDSLNYEKMQLAEYLNSLSSVFMSSRLKQTGCLSNQPWQVDGPKQPSITTGMSMS